MLPGVPMNAPTETDGDDGLGGDGPLMSPDAAEYLFGSSRPAEAKILDG